ncbi:8252_t:CDS:2, partial [Gigaspora rosea]
ALSHVFLFQEEKLQGLREFFDNELWQCIFSEIRTQYSYIEIPECVFDLCATVVKVASKQQDPRQRRNKIKSYLKSYKTNGEFEEIMRDILYNLSDSYQNSFVKTNKIEGTHCHNYLDSVIKPFFPEGKKTTMDWANRTSESSAWIKKQFVPILLGSKPDFTIRTTNPRKSIELMFAEIKPPNARSNLVNEDLVAL